MVRVTHRGNMHITLTHQTGRAGWLFEVPQVGYIAINQPEITNLTITNL